MQIGQRRVGPGEPAFIIAEIGSNHGGDLRTALAHIDAAKWAGADAAKFQLFRADRLYPRSSPHHESVLKYELPHEWLPLLADHCQEVGVAFLCTAFDMDSLVMVDPYVPAHKIGGGESAWAPYVRAVVERRKPVLMSMAPTQAWAVQPLPHDLVRLHVVSRYPADLADYRLEERKTILGVWGLSDHTLDPLTAPCSAVALGACVVEKHMRIAGAGGTLDTPVSITADDFRRMTKAIRRTELVVRGNGAGPAKTLESLRRGPRGLRGA